MPILKVKKVRRKTVEWCRHILISWVRLHPQKRYKYSTEPAFCSYTEIPAGCCSESLVSCIIINNFSTFFYLSFDWKSRPLFWSISQFNFCSTQNLSFVQTIATIHRTFHSKTCYRLHFCSYRSLTLAQASLWLVLSWPLDLRLTRPPSTPEASFRGSPWRWCPTGISVTSWRTLKGYFSISFSYVYSLGGKKIACLQISALSVQFDSTRSWKQFL